MNNSNKKKNLRFSSRWLACIVIVMTCIFTFAMSVTAFAADVTTADDATADNWAVLNYDEDEGRTTKNDGRIWTDKSVYDGNAKVLKNQSDSIEIEKSGTSSFLVGLSALASTMSVDGIADKPLDIIMVLDVSGSMDDSMGYKEVYADEMSYQNEYYIQRNNGYTELHYSYNSNRWYYETGNDNRVYITPKTSEEDTTSRAVQVYKAVSRMEALEDSVNAFVDNTKDMNSKITDTSMQHRIALVKFSGNKNNSVGNNTYNSDGHTYNYSQVVKEFAAVTDANVDSFHSAVASLTPAGATRADYGLEVAKGVMGNARENAQAVVIFFTDGKPTTFSDWSSDVANSAIGHAKDMKDDGAWIYSVGVFEEDDLTGGDLNNYMNAVSSNYPNATGYTTASMGQLAQGADYYKTAEDSDGLAKVFEDIATQITTKAAEVPTHVEEGYDADKGGYVTFVDRLGDYMEVTSFNSVVFGGVEYKNFITENAWNEADSSTDVFVNDVKVTNDLGEEVSIGSVIVTIERSDDARTGDIITVKVPAALVPLAYYNVVINEEGAAVTERIPTVPIRAFYEVSLKEEVSDLLADPDADMAEYLETNTDSDGKAVFYSNAYDASANAEIGSTVATFVPSRTNDMYFAVEDTPIFEDADCTIPVTHINESDTYYYQRVYYKESAQPIAPQYEVVAFPASILSEVTYAFDGEDGQLVVKAGNGRYTRADAADTAKAQGANKTSTASKAAAPRWENWNSETPSPISVYLGNNGSLKADVPGTLAISKKTVVPEWSNINVSDKVFKFEVLLTDGTDPVAGSFKAQIKDADGGNVGEAATLTANAEGKADVTLKDGQTLYIYGIPDGTNYTVKETDIPDGFSQTAPADDVGQAMDASGTVSAGKTSKAAFENTYKARGTLEGATSLKGSKTLEGRDWRETDVFAFALAPEDDNNPMPTNAELIDGTYMALETVSGEDEDKAFNFGDITYTEPGTYLYDIREVIIDGTADRVLGISYSQVVYEVTVTVTDNGDGTLKAEAAMKSFGDNRNVNSADFVNTFNTDKVSFGIVGLKHLTDEAGSYELKDNDFSFQLSAVTDGAPMPEGTVNGVYTTTNKGVSVSFGTIDCDLSKETIESAPDEKIIYTYEVKEIAGSIPGMQYDNNTYTINVTFTWDEEDGLLFDIAYPNTDGDEAIKDTWVNFVNTYDPEDVTVELEGIKYLKGRDWKDNETFDFVLKGLNGAPMPAAANGDSTYEFQAARTDENLDLGVFGVDITYDKPGTYVYELSEATGTAGGMDYDNYVSTITVVVTDGSEGKLTAEKTVETRTDVAADAGVSGFLNKYEAEMAYPGMTVEKTLYGRDMSFGEFDFVIEPMNPNAKTKGIAESDASFESGAHEAGETCTMTGKLSSLEFTQDDAGKEFIYKITEVLPSDDDPQHDGIQSNGVTFDETEYWAVIVPKDNGDGTMYATTAIYTDEARTNKVDEWSTNDQSVPAVEFENEYGFKDVTLDTETEVYFTKIFEGREWHDTDKFEFTMTAVTTDAPMPEGATDGKVTVKVGKPASGNTAVVDFGKLTFTQTGTYNYKVTETKGDIPGVAYDAHEAELTVTVTDNGRGNLVAATKVEAGTFTNTFSSEVTYGDVTTLDVTKSLDGRELRAQQFTFTVKPMDIASMEKIGMTTLKGIEFHNGAPGTDGVSHMFSPNSMKFTEKDLGATYTYVFSEVNEGVKGYTYDSNEYTLEISPYYEGGKIKVATKVTDQNGNVLAEEVGYTGKEKTPVITIAFENSYEAEETAAIFEGTKAMTGRSLVADEFEFVLAYAADADKTPISTVANNADGSIVFNEQTYTLDDIEELIADGYATKRADGMTDIYTISYIAYEKAGDTASVTHTESSFAFTVIVTDNGDGKLTSEVNYPKSGLAFKNTYSVEDPVDYNVKGLKVLNSSDATTPDSIEGKFAFELTAKTEGAPMPENTKVTNDALGNVDFGNITFDLDDLKDVEQDGKARTKEFVYAVTETGSVPGVTNDPVAVKTFSITLTDDGEGNLTAVADPAEGPVFTFKNTYGAEEVTESITGEGNLTVTKKLNGRDMKAGEFTFELVEGETVVAEGTNAADGTVTFDAITYERIGSHVYTVREKQGDLVGITYDDTTYQAEAVVSDNGKGSLEVEFSIVGEDAKAIEFVNEYKPGEVTLAVGPGKTLVGRELKDGEFQFKLTAVTEGAPMPESDTAVNNADGEITFGEITYSEEGTWEYTISEVKGNVKNVTYDESVYTMKVVVTDDKNGLMDLEVTFDGKEEVPTFVNTYDEPDPILPFDPEDGSDDPSDGSGNGDDSTKTGDDSNMLPFALAALAAMAGAAAALFRRKKAE